MIDKREAEIDAIRVRLYEMKKSMTRDERIEKANDTARKLAAQYGFKLVESARRTSPQMSNNAQHPLY